MGSGRPFPKLSWRRRHKVVAAALCAAATLVLPAVLREAEEHMHAAGSSSAAADALLPPPEEALRRATHLVVVAGHAVFTALDHGGGAVEREASWFLEPFQHGQLTTMIEHIHKGVELAAADNRSLVLFSGGQTRAAAGPRSEALSYWEAAEAEGWFGLPQVQPRVHLEEQARDSLENLLFSVCRFNELTGRYPQTITVVSFGFKRRRFQELHRAALRFPRHRFHFVGVDSPGLTAAVTQGETAHSAKPFESDPYGSHA